MKKILLANILILLTAVTAPVSAEDMAAPAPVQLNAVTAGPVVPPAPASTDATITPPPANTATSATPAAAATNMTGIDPTLAFFTALGSCTPGAYQEKNIISGEIGQPMLNQQIIGPGDADPPTCNATLSTPDGRTLNCAFPMDKLGMFTDQHFLQGTISDTLDSPPQEAVTADMNWSQMKAEHCSFAN